MVTIFWQFKFATIKRYNDVDNVIIANNEYKDFSKLLSIFFTKHVADALIVVESIIIITKVNDL